MKKAIKRLVACVATIMMVFAFCTTAFAVENLNVGGDYLIDQDNVMYIYKDGEFVEIKGSMSRANSGFGEDSASWITHTVKDDNNKIYTVKHKGWKERKDSTLYGVRACSKTTCSPTKNHWSQARMTSLVGTTITDSGKCWSTGTATARSPYQNVHVNNACMRSTWGGVGTVID